MTVGAPWHLGDPVIASLDHPAPVQAALDEMFRVKDGRDIQTAENLACDGTPNSEIKPDSSCYERSRRAALPRLRG
jgi:hypothetical protein